MSKQGFEEAIVAAQVSGTQLANTVTATSVIPAASKFTIPANFFDVVGKVMKITAIGNLSNVVTTPGTLTLDIRFGATIVFNGGAMQLSTTAHTTLPWIWEVFLTSRAIGTAGNLMGMSRFTSQAANISGADPTTGHSTLLAPNATPAVGSNFDTTSSQQIDLFAKFSVATNPTNIQVDQFVVEALN